MLVHVYRLECDDECRVEARTRQLALALQIRNPDVSAKLAPRYSDHVRSTAAREPAFANQVHDKLTELVQLAKKVPYICTIFCVMLFFCVIWTFLIIS